MRPIDADALQKRLGMANECENCPNLKGIIYCRLSADLVEVCDEIVNAPTIDAVPVVRCKDCKYYTEGERWCRRLGIFGAFDQNGYCSHAERKLLKKE